MSTDAPSPAWYPDPSGEQQLRWWDGSRWTEHVAPDPAAPAVAAQSAPAQEAPRAADPHPAGSYAPMPHTGAPAAPEPAAPAAAPHEATAPYATGPYAGGPAPAGAPYSGAPYGNAAYAGAPYAGAPAFPSKPRQKAFTRGTWVTLAVTALVVGGGVAGAGWGASSADAVIRAEAPEVLNGFLDAVADGDAGWSDYASPGFAGKFPAGSVPILGSVAAADLIDLDVSFDLGELVYRETGYNRDESAVSNPSGADSAAMPLTVTYTFLVDGEEQTATSNQIVWLTRPFYFGDDDTPESQRAGGSPSSVGPWRVAGVTLPAYPRDEPFDAGGTTTYDPENTEDDCGYPEAVMVSHSEYARIEGYIPALCLSGGDTTTWGERVDLDVLAAGFPPLNDSVRLSELVGIGASNDDRAPLIEYLVAADDGDYVYVFAATGPDEIGDYSDYRVVAVERMQ